MRIEHPATTIVRAIVGMALIGALFAAGWNIYRRLPSNGPDAVSSDVEQRGEVELAIILRDAPEYQGQPLNIAVEFYPGDLLGVQREFGADPHPGRRFDDFLAQRMKGQSPVRVQLDDKGRATTRLAAGNWWVRASLQLGDESSEWRLPISVNGSEQTVELTPQNAFERSKKF
jgi:hypothetical protein